MRGEGGRLHAREEGAHKFLGRIDWLGDEVFSGTAGE